MDKTPNPSLSKRYQYQKLGFSLAKTAVTLVYLFLVVSLGLSSFLAHWLGDQFPRWPLQLLCFILILGAGDFLLTAPLNLLSGYFLEHRYQLSHQSFGRFLWEGSKSLLLSLGLGIPILFLLYGLILWSPRWYWAYLAGFLFFLSVLLAQVAPKVLLPLFYKLVPLTDEDLKARLTALCGREGFTLKGVFSFNLSKNTRKANAAFLGLGRTRRIILADTLLEKFTSEEIEAVFTHEMGHLVRRHIAKQVLIGLIANFGGLFVISQIYAWNVHFFGGTSLHDLSVFPLFFFWLTLWSLLMTPLGNTISRRFEWEADEYARRKSPKPLALVSSFEKLAEINLADPDPPAWIEFFFHSHPAIRKRIAHVHEGPGTSH
jgi:STE24 endopeptidase